MNTSIATSPIHNHTQVEPLLLRSTMGSFATGVGVVMAASDGQMHGMTVNSITSVSLDPPLLLICLLKDARTTEAVEKRGKFIINILSREQKWSAIHFSKPGEIRNLAVLRQTDSGIPYIPDSLAHIECSIHKIHPGGDHLIIIGRVDHCEAQDGSPLIFYRGEFRDIARRENQNWYSNPQWLSAASW